MKHALPISLLPLMLAACTNNPSGVTPAEMITPNPVTMALTGGGAAPQNAERAATGLKDNMHLTFDKLKKWAMTPPPNPPKKAVPASYCYQSLQDILCYRQPMPGWEARLVGYQGTDAAEPPAAMIKPMPVRVADNTMLPANRAKTSKPLTVKAAVAAKPEEEQAEPEIKTISVDAAHESLPDPALAPQL